MTARAELLVVSNFIKGTGVLEFFEGNRDEICVSTRNVKLTENAVSPLLQELLLLVSGSPP